LNSLTSIFDLLPAPPSGPTAADWQRVIDFGFAATMGLPSANVIAEDKGIRVNVIGGDMDGGIAVPGVKLIQLVKPEWNDVNVNSNRFFRITLETEEGTVSFGGGWQISGGNVIMSNANNAANEWIRVQHPTNTHFYITNIEISTVDGWNDNAPALNSLTSIFDLLPDAPQQEPKLSGNHDLIPRTTAMDDIRYYLTATSHPFTAYGGTHNLDVREGKYVETIVTADGSEGIAISASAFAGAKDGDILVIRGRIIDNRNSNSSIELFSSSGGAIRAQSVTGASPWTITHLLTDTDLSGMRLLANRSDSHPKDEFMFSIDDLIIYRPAPVEPPPETGRTAADWQRVINLGFVGRWGLPAGSITATENGIRVAIRANNTDDAVTVPAIELIQLAKPEWSPSDGNSNRFFRITLSSVTGTASVWAGWSISNNVILSNANNTQNQYLRVVNPFATHFYISKIEISTVDGWNNDPDVLASLTCIFEFIDTDAPLPDPKLSGNHGLIPRTAAMNDIIYSLDLAVSNPFTAYGGTHDIDVRESKYVETIVTADDSQGVTIPSTVFNDAQAGDILVIRGRVIDNRFGDGRMGLYYSSGEINNGTRLAYADLLRYPWTITFEITDVARSGGLRLLANRWGGADQDNVMFSIDDMIIYRPVPPEPPPDTGRTAADWQRIIDLGFVGVFGLQDVPESVTATDNGIRVTVRANAEHDALTVPAIELIQLVKPEWSPGVNSMRFFRITLSSVTGTITAGAGWHVDASANTITSNANNTVNDWIRVRNPLATHFFITKIEISTVDGWNDNPDALASLRCVFTLIDNVPELCPLFSGHAGLRRATCTLPAAVCPDPDCDYFGGKTDGYQEEPLEHSFTIYHNFTYHRCDRCDVPEPHSTSTPGELCTICNTRLPLVIHDCTWGPIVSTTATCTAAGTATRNCSVAGCTISQNTPDPALGHNVVNGVCTRCNLTPCGMCGVVGDWRWGGNEGSHWAGNCACPYNAPHFFDANGRCICGATGTPSTPHTACGMCGVVGPWRWGGNDTHHWAANCACPYNAPHTFNASGVCTVCGFVGQAPDGTNTACPICGVTGPWRWGGNETHHWADNCNCTGNAPHEFDADGRCICGATRVLAPQETFREEDFIEADTLIDELRRAVEAGEVPTINLVGAGTVTIISADVFLAIAEMGVDVVVVLPSGFTFTIIAASISADVGAFDLNIVVYVEHTVAQHTTLGGGLVDVPSNSLVFKPNFHGDFGFDLVFNVTAEQLEHVGIDGATAKHFHVCAVGNVTEQAQPTYNAGDGSIDIIFSHASFHVLSNEEPVTVEVGTMVVGPPDVVEETPGTTTPGGEQGTNVVTAIQDAIAQQSSNSYWLLIIITSTVILASAVATIVMLKRRQRA
jgi:hypothetical protein